MFFIEGQFLKKNIIWFFLIFGCGLFFIGLYIFLNIVDSDATNEILTFLIIGILLCIVAISIWLFNFRAFIRVDKDSIKARYNWFGRIDCNISDVTFAAAKGNTLKIQLKDGKTYAVGEIADPHALAAEIRNNMPFEENEQTDILLEKLNSLKAARKKNIIYSCSGILLLFFNIFATVYMTGEKELYEFGRTDWIIFAIMGVIEIITVIITFYFADQSGKKILTTEKIQYNIRRRIIEEKALLPGNVIKVFADDIYSGRITVFGNNYDNSVYYAIQEFSSDYTLIKVFESEIIEDAEQMYDDFEYLYDITHKFLH